MVQNIAPTGPLSFYRITHSIVKNYPPTYEDAINGQEIRCLRLNTFSVVNKSVQLGNVRSMIEELQRTNAGKGRRDIGKEFFFSRDFQNVNHDVNKLTYSYPLLGIAEDRFRFSISDVGNQTHYFNIMIVDKYGTEEGTCKSEYCSMRLLSEVSDDLRNLLVSYIQTLAGFVYATVTDLKGFVLQDWFSLSWLEKQEESGEIESFMVLAEFCTYIDTKEFESEVFPGLLGNDNLVGVFTNIAINFQNCTPDLEIEFPNIPIIEVHGGDCSTC